MHIVLSVMAFVQAQRNLLSGDLKQLILSATGFDDNSEEFATFEKHVWSSIMQKEYPSINKTSIKSDLFCFVEKFKTHFHYFPQKAKNLQMLIDYIFKINCYKDDVLWNLLHLLLRLSTNPTSASEDDVAITFPLFKAEPVQASFDWGAYLKEGLPDYRLPSEESSEEEEESESRSAKEDINQILAKLKKINNSGIVNVSDSSMNTIVPFHVTPSTLYDTTLRNRLDPFLFRTTGESSSETVRDKITNKEELKAALLTIDSYRRTHCYWWKNPSYREQYPSRMHVPNACISWERKMVNDGVSEGDTRIISESKAMKDVIFALCHPQKCFVITKTDFGYKPAEKVSLCSTNPVDFHNSLSEVCSCLSLIEELNMFIESVNESCLCSNTPNTYIAYASGLRHVMNQYNSFLSVTGAYISQKKDIYLLSHLLLDVRPWLKLIRCLHKVHMKAVVRNWKTVDNWICASRLLAVLYESIENLFGQEKATLTVIFLKSLVPYLDILDTWLVHAKNSDTQEEFLIRRASRVMCEGHLMVEDYKSHLVQDSLKDCLFLDNFVYHSIKACSSIDFQIILQKDLFEMPEVETPFSIKYLKMLMDNLLKENPEPVCDNDVKQKYDSLNEGFVSPPNQDETKLVDIAMEQHHFGHCSIWNEFAPYLAESNIKIQSDSYNSTQLLSKIENLDLDCVNIARLLKDNFTTVISERMQPKGFAKDTLLNQYNLLGHLNTLRSVYLCCDGVKISIFTKTLFSKVVSNSLSTISWTDELRELLYEDYPVYYSNFLVCLASKTLGFQKLFSMDISYPDFIEYAHHISLTYLVAPPLNLVITSESLSKYNELFNFLLKIKWAMFCLSQLSFSDLKDLNESPLSARLISLRMYLFHNILTFEKYFLSINSEDFDSEIVDVCSVARDIHVIANALEKFLDQRRKHCFLVGSPGIYDCIIFVLQSCQEFAALWNLSSKIEFEGHVSERLSDLELMYQECRYEMAEILTEFTNDYFFKNNVNFNYLCDELFNNMPGDWEDFRSSDSE